MGEIHKNHEDSYNQGNHNTGKINADYSGFTVSKTKKLEINADYTKSVVEIAEDVNFNCDYGSIYINKLNNVTGNGDYLTMRLGEVYKNVNIKEWKLTKFKSYQSREIKFLPNNDVARQILYTANTP